MKIIQPLLLLIAALLAASSVHALGRGTPLQNFEDVLVQSVDGKPLTLEQVRKAVDIREAWLKFCPYIQNPFRLVFRTEPLRNSASIRVRASYIPDRLH